MIKVNKKNLILSFLITALAVFCFGDSLKAREDYICTIYITGIGCPNCAVTDLAVLWEWTRAYPNLVVIEYEIYKDNKANYAVANRYFKSCISPGVRPGVPFLVLNKKNSCIGRFEVLDAKNIIEDLNENSCPLVGDVPQKFKDLDIATLAGKPKIWTKDKILIRNGEGGDNGLLKKLLTAENLSQVLNGVKIKPIKPKPVLLSGSAFPQMKVLEAVEFDNAIQIDGWVFQWNGGDLNTDQMSGTAAIVESVKGNQESSFKFLYLVIPIVIFALIFIILLLKKRKI